MGIVIGAAAHASYYHSFCPILCSPAWSIATVLSCITISKKRTDKPVVEFIVIENNLPFHFIFFLFQFIKRIY